MPSTFSEETPYHDTLSWEDAVSAAGDWIGSLHIARDLTGQTVDLSAAGDSLPYEGDFRRMVIEAARRKLKRRGAKEIILPPPPM